MYAVVEEPLRDISAVGEKIAVWIFSQHFPQLVFTVVGVGGGEAVGYDLHLVVADEVHLEDMAPTHRSFAAGGKSIEHLVHISSDVVTNVYGVGVHLAHSVSPAKRFIFRKNIIRKSTPLSNST